jgi:hypothetical protein
MSDGDTDGRPAPRAAPRARLRPRAALQSRAAQHAAAALGRAGTAGLRGLAIAAIYLYQGLSSMTPACCRYHPTCSRYGLEAVRAHGPLRGGWLTLRRMLRCRPGGGWGFDPVPPACGHATCGHATADPGARATLRTTAGRGAQAGAGPADR